MKPAPLALVGVPEWGSVAVQVTAIDGDRWTVLDSIGRSRVLETEDLNLFYLVPAKVGISASRDGRSTSNPPPPAGINGAEWRSWRSKRLQQLHNCRRLGWRVVGWTEDAEDRAPTSVEILPGAVVGLMGDENFARIQAAHRTENPKYRSWTFHQKGRPPAQWIYPSGPIDPEDSRGRWWMPRGAQDWKPGRMDLRGEARPLAEGIQPFPYQAKAVQAVLAAGHGIVEAPCGAGKTGIGTFMAACVRGRTLVLVHTLDLVRQWTERLSSWLPGVSVGQLGGGKDERDRHVLVASLATLARWSWAELDALGSGFQLLICDECHHVPAETWVRVVAGLPCPSRMGLTATPERKDGLHTWMHLALGPTVFRIDQATLDRTGRTMAPTIWRLDTGVEVREGEHAAHTMRGILEDEGRQRLLRGVVEQLVAKGRRVLVLTSLVEHAQETAGALGGEALVGSVSASRRTDILARMRSGELSVIVATQLADEGLDLPELDTVVLAAPSSHKAATRQRVGRACRAQDGKRPPWVVDLVDDGPWAFRKWSARRSLYRALDWTIRSWK